MYFRGKELRSTRRPPNTSSIFIWAHPIGITEHCTEHYILKIGRNNTYHHEHKVPPE
jgi:hypothetical protein